MDRKIFQTGLKDGLPICFGYFAVAFSLGIAMRNAGMNSLQGFLLSLLNLASAGEYADVQVIAADAAYVEIILVTLIANARYLLMSTALSQKFSSDTSIIHRFFVGYAITDELFGIASNQPVLHPEYYYGAMAVAVPGWCAGTVIGIVAGNILPDPVVSALSVALYGMFLAIIIPPASKDKATGILVVLGFVCSFLWDYIPFINQLTSGTKTIILTIILASVISILFPHKEADHEA